jgi:hypothetical protein
MGKDYATHCVPINECLDEEGKCTSLLSKSDLSSNE